MTELWIGISLKYWRLCVIFSILFILKLLEKLVLSIIQNCCTWVDFWLLLAFVLFLFFSLKQSNVDRRRDKLYKKLREYDGILWPLETCDFYPEYHHMQSLRRKIDAFDTIDYGNFVDWFTSLLKSRKNEKKKMNLIFEVDLIDIFLNVFCLFVFFIFIYVSILLIY